jgi:hypothetical protein
MRSEGDDSAERAGTKVDAHGWVKLALCDGERSAVAVAGRTPVTVVPDLFPLLPRLIEGAKATGVLNFACEGRVSLPELVRALAPPGTPVNVVASKLNHEGTRTLCNPSSRALKNACFFSTTAMVTPFFKFMLGMSLRTPFTAKNPCRTNCLACGRLDANPIRKTTLSIRRSNN